MVERASPSDEAPRCLSALRQKMAAYQRPQPPALLAAVLRITVTVHGVCRPDPEMT